MKKFLQKIDKVYAGVILALASILLMITGLEIIRAVGFPDTNFDYLPAENTIFAVEWINDFTNEEVKNLHSLVGLANSKKILDADINFVPEELQDALDLRSQKYKTFALEKVGDQTVKLFVYEVEDEAPIQAIVNEMGWYSVMKGSRILITESKELAEVLKGTFISVSSTDRFVDSYSNIPKLTFGDVYVNHKLMPKFTLSSDPVVNHTKSVLDFFAVSVASVKIEADGVYISTYTNPKDESLIKFPFTHEKYRAGLMNSLPKDPEVMIGGIDLVSRLEVWLENLSGSKTTALIKNLVISNNLEMDAVDLFKEIFSKEYALAFYEEEPVLVLEKLDTDQEQNLVDQLQKLSANNNPKRISYQLEDGQVARQLVPNESTEYDNLGDGLYRFDLNQEGDELYLLFSDSTYLTKSRVLLDNILERKVSFADTPEYKNEYIRLMSVSDEVLYLSREKVAELSGLYLEDAPSITSSFNYFDDGIQTVHYLKW